MFNPLTPAEMTVAIGAAARAAARSEGPLGAFDRTQLLSAYSGARHIAVELAAFDAELRAFSRTVSDRIAVAAEALGSRAPHPVEQRLTTLAGELREAADAGRVGELVCELLDLLREDPSEPLSRLRGEVQGSLREVCDREVESLADAIENRGRARR